MSVEYDPADASARQRGRSRRTHRVRKRVDAKPGRLLTHGLPVRSRSHPARPGGRTDYRTCRHACRSWIPVVASRCEGRRRFALHESSIAPSYHSRPEGPRGRSKQLPFGAATVTVCGASYGSPGAWAAPSPRPGASRCAWPRASARCGTNPGRRGGHRPKPAPSHGLPGDARSLLPTARRRGRRSGCRPEPPS